MAAAVRMAEGIRVVVDIRMAAVTREAAGHTVGRFMVLEGPME